MSGAAKHAARTLAWGTAFYVGTLVAEHVFSRNGLGAAAVQAALTEWGAGRTGVRWTEAEGPAAGRGLRGVAARAGRGLGLGLAAAALVAAFLVVSRGASLAVAKASASPLLLGLLVAALTAVKEELLFRGFVLRAFHALLPLPGRLAAVGLVAAAARYGAGATAAADLGFAAAAGVAFGALWERDRGAWLAWGAHVGWAFATGPVLHGLLDLRLAEGAWGGAAAGLEGSLGAAVAAAVLAGASTAFALRSATRTRLHSSETP